MNTHQLSTIEEHLILEALNLLIVDKQSAYSALSQAAPNLLTGRFPITVRDFGIPEIQSLIKRIGGTV